MLQCRASYGFGAWYFLQTQAGSGFPGSLQDETIHNGEPLTRISFRAPPKLARTSVNALF
jgi:hypothetical protein